MAVVVGLFRDCGCLVLVGLVVLRGKGVRSTGKRRRDMKAWVM